MPGPGWRGACATLPERALGVMPERSAGRVFVETDIEPGGRKKVAHGASRAESECGYAEPRDGA